MPSMQGAAVLIRATGHCGPHAPSGSGQRRCSCSCPGRLRACRRAAPGSDTRAAAGCRAAGANHHTAAPSNHTPPHSASASLPSIAAMMVIVVVVWVRMRECRRIEMKLGCTAPRGQLVQPSTGRQATCTRGAQRSWRHGRVCGGRNGGSRRRPGAARPQVCPRQGHFGCSRHRPARTAARTAACGGSEAR